MEQGGGEGRRVMVRRSRLYKTQMTENDRRMTSHREVSSLARTISPTVQRLCDALSALLGSEAYQAEEEAPHLAFPDAPYVLVQSASGIMAWIGNGWSVSHLFSHQPRHKVPLPSYPQCVYQLLGVSFVGGGMHRLAL